VLLNEAYYSGSIRECKRLERVTVSLAYLYPARNSFAGNFLQE